jgi:multiple sugar transport system permease protein
MKDARARPVWTRVNTAILTAFAVVLAVLFILPMIYTVVSSLKPRDEIFEFPIRWIPQHVALANFAGPFHKLHFDLFIENSTIVASAVTLASLVFCSMAGYSLAKFGYRGRNALFVSVLLTMMLPIEITIVPLALVVRLLGLMNTKLVLILPVMITPLGVFWMRQFLLTLPDDYVDAGRIDGLGELAIFWRVVMPMSLPALGALSIFTFMTNWNSLIWPLIVATRDATRTFPVGLVAMIGEYDTMWNELFAMAVVAVAPTLIVFLILRGRLIQGMARARGCGPREAPRPGVPPPRREPGSRQSIETKGEPDDEARASKGGPQGGAD